MLIDYYFVLVDHHLVHQYHEPLTPLMFENLLAFVVKNLFKIILIVWIDFQELKMLTLVS